MCEECNWEELVSEIAEMLDDSDFDFALDTLEGIEEWVLDNEHCTENQKTAVENISCSKRD